MVGNRLSITKAQPPRLCLPLGLLRARATEDGLHQRAQIPKSSLGHGYTAIPLRRHAMDWSPYPPHPRGLDLHDFTLFGVPNPVQIFDKLVGQLLQPVSAALQVVGRDLFLLFLIAQFVMGIAPDIADGNL